jgi:hypothetical protein
MQLLEYEWNIARTRTHRAQPSEDSSSSAARRRRSRSRRRRSARSCSDSCRNGLAMMAPFQSGPPDAGLCRPHAPERVRNWEARHATGDVRVARHRPRTASATCKTDQPSEAAPLPGPLLSAQERQSAAAPVRLLLVVPSGNALQVMPCARKPGEPQWGARWLSVARRSRTLQSGSECCFGLNQNPLCTCRWGTAGARRVPSPVTSA